MENPLSVLESVRRSRNSRIQSGRTGWIGIDIGTGAIKIAQVERTAGRFRIARSVIVHAPEGFRYDHTSLEDGHISEEIRNAISLHGGFIGRAAACVVSMSLCELRTLTSARGSEDEQRELISLELQQDASHAAEPREFDFWDVASASQDEGMDTTQVHVVSVPRSLADSVGTTLLDSKLRGDRLDVVPFCALRAAEMDGTSVTTDMASSRTCVMLDWGYSVATVVVIRNGRPVLARCLRECGLSRLFRRITDRLKLTHIQTDTLLMNYGIRRNRNRDTEADELRDLIAELAFPLLHDLTEELTQTLEFLKMQYAGGSPVELVVCGGGGAVPGVAQHLEATLRIPVRAWRLPLRSADLDQPEPILANAAALSVLAWEQ